MAIVWGAWSYAGGNGMRVGIDAWWSAVDTNSTTVTLTYQVWTENQYWHNDWQMINYGGDDTGSEPFNNNSGSGAVQRSQWPLTYSYPAGAYGYSPGGLNVKVWITGTYKGYTPSVDVTFPAPARPYAIPAVPPWIGVNRVNDSRVDVAWGHAQTAQAPYTAQLLQRNVLTDGTWSGWADYVWFGGIDSAHVDTNVQANRVYSYRVRSGNPSGDSGWTPATEARMTPGAPVNVASVLNGNVTVTTSWTRTNYFNLIPEVTFVVERSVAGGAWTSVASGVTGTSWIDAAPVAGENRYRVAAFTSVGNLTSDYAAGGPVNTISTPLAPTSAVLSNTGASSFSVTFAGHQLTAGDPRKWNRVDIYSSVDEAAYVFRGSVLTSTAADNTFAMSIPGISTGAKVQAKVVAVNAAGDSEPRNSNLAYTKPNPVQTISAVRDGYVSESATVTWTATAWPGSTYKIVSVVDGVSTETAVVTKTYTHSLPLAKSATYTVYVIGPDAQVSAASPAATAPSRTVDKTKIPGFKEIYQGATLVRAVTIGSSQIWLR